MVRITGRHRLLIRAVRPAHRYRSVTLGVPCLFLLLALAGLPVAASNRMLGPWAMVVAALVPVAVFLYDYGRALDRTFVTIDARAGLVARHRRGLLQWRTDARLADFIAIGIAGAGHEESEVWRIQLERADGRHPLTLMDVADPVAATRPFLLRLAEATGLPLSSAAQRVVDGLPPWPDSAGLGFPPTVDLNATRPAPIQGDRV